MMIPMSFEEYRTRTIRLTSHLNLSELTEDQILNYYMDYYDNVLNFNKAIERKQKTDRVKMVSLMIIVFVLWLAAYLSTLYLNLPIFNSFLRGIFAGLAFSYLLTIIWERYE